MTLKNGAVSSVCVYILYAQGTNCIAFGKDILPGKPVGASTSTQSPAKVRPNPVSTLWSSFSSLVRAPTLSPTSINDTGRAGTWQNCNWVR